MNRPVTKAFYLKNGAVRTSGGANQLTDGQFAVVDVKNSTSNGPAVVGTFVGKPKNDKRFQFQVGGPNIEPTRSFSNKNNASGIFKLNEVKELRKSIPQRTEITYDEVIIGYDGFDATKSLSFKKNTAYWNIALKLFNGAIQYRGGSENCEFLVEKIHLPNCGTTDTCIDCEPCDAVPCRDIVMDAITRLRNRPITGGNKVSDFIEITPVFGGCEVNPTPETTAYVYWTLEVCDTGDQEALAAVAAQYNVPVIRINRVGAISTYQVLISEDASDPADYVQSVDSLIKGCADCPEGYTEVPGGILYAITIEDSGTDKSSVITAALANAKYVSGTIRKNGNDAGVGNYTAIYSSEITEAEITTFANTTTNARNTATVNKVGLASAFCSNTDTTEIEWVEGDSCDVVEETYAIILPDGNNCGDSRLAELQAAYPSMTIAIDVNPALRSRTITLTGTEGGAYINVGGTDYTATWDTNLTDTAAAFVTDHAATLLATHGVTVTSAAAVLTFSGPTAIITALTITNDGEADSDLAGTLGTVTQNVPYRVNCSTQYTASVVSNMVCDACSDVFKDFYVTEAPNSFDGTKWFKTSTDVNPSGEDCLCGIRFKSKYFVLSGNEYLQDMVSFTESVTQIEVSSGFADEVREGIGQIPVGTDAKTTISKHVPRTHLYGMNRTEENESRAFFRGTNYQPSSLTRILLGEENAVADNVAQFISYYVQIAHTSSSGGLGDTHTQNSEYEFRVQVGKQAALEAVLNNLAGAVGNVEGV